MQKLLLAIGTVAFALAPATASAYQGYFDPIRFGEHPYDVRREELAARKRIKRIYNRLRVRSPYAEIYHHPAFADRRQLHPFYRQDGRSYINDGSTDFVNWRGYLPPNSIHSMSPDTHCLNFGGHRPYNRFAPFGYTCFGR